MAGMRFNRSTGYLAGALIALLVPSGGFAAGLDDGAAAEVTATDEACAHPSTDDLQSAGADAARGPILDARGVRHLLNRFAFGASSADLERFVGLRAGDVLDALLVETRAPSPAPVVLLKHEDYGVDQNGNEVDAPELLALEPAERSALQVQMRTIDKMQLRDYLDEWLGGALGGRDPLRDRMTLFWHGFFPTSVRATLRRYELIRQHELLRSAALGSFRDLLHGIVRDAAMLTYFDNDTSIAGHPHENFARELLELYSLGEGNYTEEDVREAARALTGYQGTRGEFHFEASVHDAGEKTIFGRTGRFDGDDLAELLLEHPACARHVSRRLLAWMEGVEPGPERAERYAVLLRDLEYELLPWLRALAADPDFYREEIVGTRIMAPIELLVSTTRRLGIEGDPAFVYFAGALLGQLIYAPPSVKGWDEGEAWVTSERLQRRDHCMGLLVHALPLALAEERPELTRELLDHLAERTHSGRLVEPQLANSLRASLGRGLDDEELAERALEAWLAREPDDSARDLAPRLLTWLREEAQLPEGPLLALGMDLESDVEGVLRRFAHELLALPIAQMH